MKIYSIFFLLLFTTFSATQAQNVSYRILSQTDNEMHVTVQFPKHQLIPIDIEGVMHRKLQMNGCYPINNLGSPELLKSVFSIIIADIPENVIIESTDFEIIENINLIPSKGKLYRNVNPDTIPYHKGERYLLNQFIEDEQLAVSPLYQFRDLQGINISCMPFAYNPVTKQLKVYHSIEFVIHSSSGFSLPLMEKKNKEYDKIYQERFLN
ncbi:MAG: hypothetical protein LBV46_04585, partial [Bacteroidales bacterium]|nr:hypothetical protein [Bacteroidales bacterium]